MKMTSAQAAKLLRQWNESLKALQRRRKYKNLSRFSGGGSRICPTGI